MVLCVFSYAAMFPTLAAAVHRAKHFPRICVSLQPETPIDLPVLLAGFRLHTP